MILTCFPCLTMSKVVMELDRFRDIFHDGPSVRSISAQQRHFVPPTLKRLGRPCGGVKVGRKGVPTSVPTIYFFSRGTERVPHIRFSA